MPGVPLGNPCPPRPRGNCHLRDCPPETHLFNFHLWAWSKFHVCVLCFDLVLALGTDCTWLPLHLFYIIVAGCCQKKQCWLWQNCASWEFHMASGRLGRHCSSAQDILGCLNAWVLDSASALRENAGLIWVLYHGFLFYSWICRRFHAVKAWFLIFLDTLIFEHDAPFHLWPFQ
jgi:hypothetical protein